MKITPEELEKMKPWLMYSFTYTSHRAQRCCAVCPDASHLSCHRKLGHVGPHVVMQTECDEAFRWFCGGKAWQPRDVDSQRRVVGGITVRTLVV